MPTAWPVRCGFGRYDPGSAISSSGARLRTPPRRWRRAGPRSRRGPRSAGSGRTGAAHGYITHSGTLNDVKSFPSSPAILSAAARLERSSLSLSFIWGSRR